MNAPHIAVVNFTRMGDLVQSGPLMRSLKTAHPGARLTAIVFKAFVDVARRLPMVDDVLVFDVDDMVPRLDTQRGDLASAYTNVLAFLNDHRLMGVDVLYNLAHTPQSATLCGLMRSRSAHGRVRLSDGQMRTEGEWFTYLFSVMQERRYNPFNLVEIYLRTNPRWSNCHPLELRVTEEDRATAAGLLGAAGLKNTVPYVVMQPGASSRSRQWPPACFADLATRLSRVGLNVVITGSSSECDLAAQIAGMSGGRAISICGRTDVGVLAAVLEGAQRLVSNDTGTIHLAAAVRTPTVGIYLGPAAAKDTAPYGNGHRLIEADIACAPCGYHQVCQTSACHRHVTADTVFRLCMADERTLNAEAKVLAGVRVYRTRLDVTGTFSLERLNDPQTGPDFHLLDFYRTFWDGLLRDDTHPGKLVSVPLAIQRPEWRRGLERLRTILESAERWLFATLEEGRRVPLDPKRFAALLHNGAHWQNDLRLFSEDYPALAPVSRYLLIRLQNVRAVSLHEHLEDLCGVIATFEKAVALLGTAAAPVAARRERATTA